MPARDSGLTRDEIRTNRYRALASCLRMIFSENRCTLFRIMRSRIVSRHQLVATGFRHQNLWISSVLLDLLP